MCASKVNERSGHAGGERMVSGERERETAFPTEAEGSTSGPGGPVDWTTGADNQGRARDLEPYGLESSEAALTNSDYFGSSNSDLDDRDRCEIGLLRNVYYHEERAAFFARINRAIDFFILVSGLATVATLSNLLPGWLQIDGRIIAAAVSIVGALQLVFRFNNSEQIHTYLRKRFLELHADLADGDEVIIARRSRTLYPEEPPTYHAVDAIAYNAAMRAFHRPEPELLAVRWWHKLLRNFVRFSPNSFPRRSYQP